ncbi:succinate dehydrogenase, cytochrome b556 subunit [Paracoccaceae bacterium]|nr:succinate dehydrogenase, cytochrome b556 subunit [Paracoccaceae bacterium]
MDNRPLSPHLTVYKPQITSVLSIFHRITGAGLSVGTVLVVLWLASVAAGEDAFNDFNNFLNNPLTLFILIASLWALWYHFCTGLRHLYWDMGYGYNLRSVAISGWVAVVSSFLLTLLTILFLVS